MTDSIGSIGSTAPVGDTSEPELVAQAETQPSSEGEYSDHFDPSQVRLEAPLQDLSASGLEDRMKLFGKAAIQEAKASSPATDSAAVDQQEQVDLAPATTDVGRPATTNDGRPIYYYEEGDLGFHAYPAGVARDDSGAWRSVGDDGSLQTQFPEIGRSNPDFLPRPDRVQAQTARRNEDFRAFEGTIAAWGPLPTGLSDHLSQLREGGIGSERTAARFGDVVVYSGPAGPGQREVAALHYRSTDLDHYLENYPDGSPVSQARLLHSAAQSWNRDMHYFVEELGYSPAEARGYLGQLSDNLTVIMGVGISQAGRSIDVGMSHADAFVSLIGMTQDGSLLEAVQPLLPDPGRSLRANERAQAMSEDQRLAAWQRSVAAFP